MNHELFYKLHRLEMLLRRFHMDSAKQRPARDASRGQGRILAILKLRDGVSTKDLSYLLGIRVSSLNELLSKLEKNGYITREPSDQDKRVMLIKLTEKGRSEQLSESPDLSDIFSDFSQDEQAQFAEYLDRMISSLEEKFGSTDEEFRRMNAMQERFFGDRRRFEAPPFGDFGNGDDRKFHHYMRHMWGSIYDYEE